MNKIKAKPYEGEEEPRTCSISGSPYHQKTGLEFYRMGADNEGLPIEEPISPAAAINAGFEFNDDLRPPQTVKTRVELSGWLLKLGLKPSSDHYRKLYAEHAPLYSYK